MTIRKFLRGEELARDYTVAAPSQYVEPVQLTEDEIAQLERPEMPCMAVETRLGNFDTVELGLTEAMAVKESRRCLRCDLER